MDLMRSDRSLFFSGFMKNPRAVGAILPSSPFLTEEILSCIDWDRLQAIAEIGPGTGPFTRGIVERCRENTRFFAVEIDPQFVEHLTARFPGLDIVQADASQLVELCTQRGIAALDAVISGLPWAVFSNELQRKLLTSIFDSLASHGTFSTFAYLHGLQLSAGKRFREMLHERFSSVEISRVVWRNVPPAIVYHCRKN